jgi:hypothetical protein
MILDLRNMPETPRCKKYLYKESREGCLFIYLDAAKTNLFIRTTLGKAAALLDDMQNRGYTVA